MDTHSSVISGLRDSDRQRHCRPRVVMLALCLFSLLSIAVFSYSGIYTTPRSGTYPVSVLEFMALFNKSPIYFQTTTPPFENVFMIKDNVVTDTLTVENNFRLKFRAWDRANDYNIGPEAGDEKNGYFTYLCDHKFLCGGWADQLKGFMISYLIANLTKRAFKAKVTRLPCDVNPIYLVPNKVNWTTSSDFGTGHRKKKYIRMGGRNFKRDLAKTNLTEYFDHETKYLFMRSNLEGISGIMKSKIYANELSWTKNLTPAEVYAAVYKRLFNLSPHLATRLNEIISTNLPTPRHRLVCIHVRLGHGAFTHDHQTRNSLANLPRIWSFIESKSRSKLDRVFVMSDSQSVIESAKNQSFADRLITIPGDIVHVDKFRLQHQSANVACRGFEKLLLEHHLMMNCDVMVRGHSGLSVIASLIRASNKDLYCLQDNGTIFPCEMNDFSWF